MPIVTLTKLFLQQLSNVTPSSRITLFFDTEIKGFVLEHRRGGGKTFYFRYRDYDKKVRMERLGKIEEISLDEARERAFRIQKLVEEGGNPKIELHKFSVFPTFGEFVKTTYIPYIQIHKRSAWMDVTLLNNHLLPIFENYRIDRIRRKDIINMQNHSVNMGFAPGTCNRWLILMRYIFNCAIRWEVLPPNSNPTSGVDLLNDNGARERYLTKEEVKRLFDIINTNPNKQVGLIIKLLLYTGARKREILDAKWEHVDLEKRVLTVPLSKSGKPRHIALSDAAVEIIQSLPREKNVPWLFFNPKTKKPPVTIFCAWNSIRKKAGIPDVRLHDLRHSFASFLVNSGRSLYEVQKLLGHYDPKVTMRYAHLSQSGLVEAANIVSLYVVDD